MTTEALTIIDHIKMRPAMYIGDLSIRGLKTMFRHFFDDILNNNRGNIEISIELKTDNLINLKVNNIDTDIFLKTIDSLNAEKKFVSFGLPVIIALSEQIELTIAKKSLLLSLNAQNGVYKHAVSTSESEINFIEIDFKIDLTVFKDVILDYEILNQFIRRYALIYKNFKFVSIDSRKETKQVNIFEYPNGLSHQLDFKIGEQYYGKSFFRLDLNTRIEEYEYQICFSYQNVWLGQTYILTYANYDELIFGGSFEKGILEGITLALKKLVDKRQIEIDKRKIKEQLILVAAIKGDNFDFCGSTKAKLNMPQVRKVIKEYVTEQILTYLSDKKDIEEEFINKHRKNE
jgi:DNA gyrase/topoisomerase IV subunit B